MSRSERAAPFNSHRLFPLASDYTPLPAQVLIFYRRLIEIGTLQSQPAISLRLPTQEEVYVRNARTGEEIATGVKRMQKVPVSTFAQVEELIEGADQYILAAKGSCSEAGSSFDLREMNGSKADPSKPCDLTVKCIVRDRRTQLSEPWHEHLRHFLLPKEERAYACQDCGAIHEPEKEVQPRFWIEFIFGGAHLPSFNESATVFDPTIQEAAEQAFQAHFFHGRFFD
jgi:hypothetical protein